MEKELRYSGENGIRYHPMVVRAVAALPLAPTGAASFEKAFDLAGISASIREYLDDYEAKGHRGDPFRFGEKKSRIGRSDLGIVAFVEDGNTHHVLQAAWLDLSPAGATRTATE